MSASQVSSQTLSATPPITRSGIERDKGSKTCSECGHVFDEMKLSDRWIDCPGCGLSLDRDHNAAINILRRGLDSLGGDGQSLWAQSSLMSEGLAQEAAGF